MNDGSDHGQPGVRVRLFGEVDVEGEQGDPTVRLKPLSRALLARLALAPGKRLDTEELAKLLVVKVQPGTTVGADMLRSAQQQLRNAQWELRKRLGKGRGGAQLLGSGRHWVALEGARTDYREFLEAVSRGDGERARTLAARGEFLAGIDDPWAEPYRRTVQEGLRRLASPAHRDRGTPPPEPAAAAVAAGPEPADVAVPRGPEPGEVPRPGGPDADPARATRPGGSDPAPARATLPGESDPAPARATRPSGPDADPARATRPGGPDADPARATLPGESDPAPARATRPGGPDADPARATRPGGSRALKLAAVAGAALVVAGIAIAALDGEQAAVPDAATAPPDIAANGDPVVLAARPPGRCQLVLRGASPPRVTTLSAGGQTLGQLQTYYEPAQQRTCAKLVKPPRSPLRGKLTHLALTLCGDENRCERDWHAYPIDAGPVVVPSRDGCVSWRVSIGDGAGGWPVRSRVGRTGCS